jgi:hypothetical protein
MQLRNTQPHLFLIEGQRILPGINVLDVDDKTQKRIEDNEQFQTWKALGWIKKISSAVPLKKPAPPPETKSPAGTQVDVLVQQGQEPAHPANSLASLNAKQAQEAVKACNDPEKLLQWFELDSRVTVKEAIEQRIINLDTSEKG